MKKKNIFFVLLICFINSSCNKEEQTDELQDKDFYSDVTTRASYISGTITGEMNPYVSDGYYTYDLSIPIQKQSVGIRISAVGGEARFKTNYQERFESTWVTQIPAGKNHFPINGFPTNDIQVYGLTTSIERIKQHQYQHRLYYYTTKNESNL